MRECEPRITWRHPVRRLLAAQEHAWETGRADGVLLAGGLVRAIGLVAAGTVELPRGRVGEVLTMADGQRWRIFRQLRVVSGTTEPPGGEVRLRFVTSMQSRLNQQFSWLTIAAFMGLPGFVDKTWITNDATGASGSIYHWRTVEDARRYSHSVALRFITGRSLAGSVLCAVSADATRPLDAPWPPNSSGFDEAT